MVIVGFALFSFGVFSPNSSLQNTATGFDGLAVSQVCIPGGALALTITNTQSAPIEITYINVTSGGVEQPSISSPAVLDTQQSQLFFVKSSCTSTTNQKYSSNVVVTYYTGSSINPSGVAGPYFSNGTVSGTPSSNYAPIEAANFNGTAYIEQTSGFAWMNNAAQPFTISLWVNPYSSNGVIVTELGQSAINSNWHDSWIELVNGNAYVRVWSLGCISLGSVPTNTWTNIIMTGSISGSTINYSGYINGVLKASGTGTRSVPGGGSFMFYPIGPMDSTNCGSGAYYNGRLSNYQFYNATLSQSQVSKLYGEGIGGAPVIANRTAIWWPLDGNALDYSGNGNNGYSFNVNWTTS